MTDRLTSAQRSHNMARIRGTHTAPERMVRSALHRAGFRFRLYRRDLPGHPDVVLPKYSAVVFVHGCFWHRHPGCIYATSPKTRASFWSVKLSGNRKRDIRQTRSLLGAGWRVLVVWECALRKPDGLTAATASAIKWLRGHSASGEIPAGSGSNRSRSRVHGRKGLPHPR
jgi:DNA mismatch endonuclease (patch repair protein)